jgi:predicted membrane protein (TIGR00267 family)
MNAFDGAMTVMGIVIGAWVGGVSQPEWILSAGLGACLAMGVSGFCGAYMVEEAERIHELKELEKAMLKRLETSVIGRASRFAPLWTALIDGLSPSFTSLICMLPFFLALVGLLPVSLTTWISVGLTLATLFGLGAYLGKVSERSVWVHGLKMFLAGLGMVGVLFLLKMST